MRALILALFVSSLALAEVPPPGTSRKGPIVVTPQGMDAHEYDLKDYAVVKRGARPTIQQRLDGLRKKVRELEGELSKPKALPVQVPYERVVERVVTRDVETSHKHRVSLYGGIAPDGVHAEDGTRTETATLHERGTAVGASYSYLFYDRWSATAFGSLTTRSTYIPSGFVGLGYDF